MKVQLKSHSKLLIFFQAAFVFAWLVNLQNTDSFYNIYVLCAWLGLFCLYDNFAHGRELTGRNKTVIVFLSVLFSAATLLANYSLFEPITALISLFNLCCSFLGGFFIGCHILLCALNRVPFACSREGREHPVRFYLLCFVSFSAVFLLYLFFTAYPGYLSTDSLNSLNQINSGTYVNDNPFWYTMLVKLCVNTGLAVFGEINAAVAFYSAVQILVMALCFAYGVVTLYQAGIPKWCIAVTFCVYAFLPYNLAYSVTMWKDVLFGGSALLLIASMYRIFKQVGASKVLNYVVFLLGSIGFCLMRTNGWFAYFATAIILLLILRKASEGKKPLLIMLGVLIICWILTNPVLSLLGVGKTDFVETLSVPFQQIARVIANDCEISEEDTALLSQVFWMDRVKELYSPEIVDPIKFEAFRQEQRSYFTEHFGEYVHLWLRLGRQYPGEYLKAWVELTKGFWNGGYYFWIYCAWTYPETSGIGGFVMNNPINDGFTALFRLLEKPVVFEPLYSIGLHVWAVVACCGLCALEKRKEAILTVPILVLIVGLWVGTPVYAEYRYAYPMFTSFPLILLSFLFASGQAMEGKTVHEEGCE